MLEIHDWDVEKMQPARLDACDAAEKKYTIEFAFELTRVGSYCQQNI
jgi:hypothetical protein